MVAEVELGAGYVRLICGEPPEGCEVGVMWHEHDSGSYATVGLYWETDDTPWDYLSRAEDALRRFDEAVDWTPIEADEDEDDGEGEGEEEDELEGASEGQDVRRALDTSLSKRPAGDMLQSGDAYGRAQVRLYLPEAL